MAIFTYCQSEYTEFIWTRNYFSKQEVITSYQGGKVETRSNRFENRRTQDPKSVPQMNKSEKMGPWISQYRWWIRDLLEKNGCPSKGFASRQEIGPQRPLDIPIPSPFYPENS